LPYLDSKYVKSEQQNRKRPVSYTKTKTNRIQIYTFTLGYIPGILAQNYGFRAERNRNWLVLSTSLKSDIVIYNPIYIILTVRTLTPASKKKKETTEYLLLVYLEGGDSRKKLKQDLESIKFSLKILQFPRC
jgi:hypothetical protein